MDITSVRPFDPYKQCISKDTLRYFYEPNPSNRNELIQRPVKLVGMCCFVQRNKTYLLKVNLERGFLFLQWFRRGRSGKFSYASVKAINLGSAQYHVLRRLVDVK